MLKQLDNGGVDLFEVTLECLPLILPDDCSAKVYFLVGINSFKIK